MKKRDKFERSPSSDLWQVEFGAFANKLQRLISAMAPIPSPNAGPVCPPRMLLQPRLRNGFNSPLVSGETMRLQTSCAEHFCIFRAPDENWVRKEVAFSHRFNESEEQGPLKIYPGTQRTIPTQTEMENGDRKICIIKLKPF